jgi:hypothetical protein
VAGFERRTPPAGRWAGGGKDSDFNGLAAFPESVWQGVESVCEGAGCHLPLGGGDFGAVAKGRKSMKSISANGGLSATAREGWAAS